MSRTYREGELVWAKMRGHPHWPAKVARSPKGQARPQGKLWIFFYGTHQHAWLPAADLCGYHEHRERFSQPKKVKGFAEAIWEIEEDPDLVITLGKPPSKKRRCSAARGQPKDGSCVEQVWHQPVCDSHKEQFPPQTSSVTAEERTPPPKPLPSPSSNEPQSAGRPRYITRQQKRSSEGIVAQITQNFAARMELKSPKSPRLKFSVASEEKSGDQSCEGNSTASQEKERDVQSSELVTPPKRQRRKTRSSSRLAKTPLNCEPTLHSAVKLEEEEMAMECVAEGMVDGPTAGGEVTSGEKREEEVVKMGAETAIEGENVTETVDDMEADKTLEENLTETTKTEKEKVSEAAEEKEANTAKDNEHVSETAKEEENNKIVKEEEKVAETEPNKMEVAEKEGEGENVEKEKGRETADSPVSVSAEGRIVEACEGDDILLATSNSCQQVSSSDSDDPPGCKGIPTNKEDKVDLPRFSVHKDMPLTEVLMVLNYNLKASLALQALDLPAAIATLRQLQNVQATAKDLQLVPDVVATLRKVRRFSGDAGVRGLAEEVYSSLKAMFQGQENESTSSKEGVRRKTMVARGGIGGKAPSRGKRAIKTSSKPVVRVDPQGRSDDQTVPQSDTT